MNLSRIQISHITYIDFFWPAFLKNHFVWYRYHIQEEAKTGHFFSLISLHTNKFAISSTIPYYILGIYFIFCSFNCKKDDNLENFCQKFHFTQHSTLKIIKKVQLLYIDKLPQRLKLDCF